MLLMTYGFRLLLVPCITFLFAACHAEPQVSREPSKKVAKRAAAKVEKKSEAKKEPDAPREPEKFPLPFAWEAAQDEPLSLTRAFLREASTDNEAYMLRGEKFFAAFADKQTPRATVITCADSRVHNTAWDATPENDDFTIRNIGNQVANAEGSVEYGIEHLGTPLFLVVGHTGCGAVKAAMGDISKLSEPIRKELEHLQVPKPTPGKAPEAAWAEAVIANVNNQVAFALKRFSFEVHESKLTVVGAVYDFRNDLGQGAGKLLIINVNGNADPERMISFAEAVNGRAKDTKGSKEKKLKGAHAEASSAVEAIAKAPASASSASATRPGPLPEHGAAEHAH